jgi:ParB family transcriptional regulator, chromosome partitioning protein
MIRRDETAACARIIRRLRQPEFRMSGKKPSLGRGLAELSPLLAQRAKGQPRPIRAAVGDRLASLPLDLLQRGKYQPRVDMRPNPSASSPNRSSRRASCSPSWCGRSGRARIRRIAALRNHRRRTPLARRANGGDREIPAVIRDVPDEAAVAMALIENIQRENLNPLEEARALSRLIERIRADAPGGGRGGRPLARRRQQSAAAHGPCRRGQGIAGAAQHRNGSCARAAGLELAPPADRGRRHGRGEGLVGARYRSPGAKTTYTGGEPNPSAAPVDPDIRRLERELAEKLGAKVLFQHGSSGKGKLVVSYNSLDELDGILSHIK